jgi:RimJ/RimL family protein N-acetyltransferase
MTRRELIPLFTELRGPRITVRQPQLSDAQTIFDAILESREELRPFLPFVALYEKPDGMDEMRAFIIRSQAQWILRQDFICGFWRTDDGHYLGSIGLHPRNWDVPSFEIGYWQRTGNTGQGYMTEAARLITDFAFTGLGAQRVMIRCDARNARSAAVARRLGFVQEGLFRNAEPSGAEGALRDILYFARIPTDPPMP